MTEAQTESDFIKVVTELAAIFRPAWIRRGEQFTYRWQLGQNIAEGMKMRITNEQRVKVSVQPLTAAGNPATIDGEVTFASSDVTVATIERISANECWVNSVNGANGATQVSASFDADLGEGVRPVEMSGALEVVPAEAVTAEITFGTPELKP